MSRLLSYKSLKLLWPSLELSNLNLWIFFIGFFSKISPRSVRKRSLGLLRVYPKESKREWLNLSRYNQIIPACVFKTNFMSQVRAWNGKVKWCISFRNINWGQKRSKVMTNKYKTTFEYLFDQFLWDRDWASQIIARIVIFSIHQPENSGLPDWIVLLHQHLFNGFF